MDFNKIKILSGKKNLSIPQLAEKSGMDKQKLYPILKRQDCTVKTLEAISEALDVSPAYWWEDEKDNQNKIITNQINEPKMNYGETILREDHLREVYQLNREIKRLEKMLEQATGINFNSKTAG